MEPENRLTRRKLIKVLAGSGAVLAATPLIASANAMQGRQNVEENISVAQTGFGNTDGTLVIVVKGSELVGYRGEEEIRLTDASLSSRLSSTFQPKGSE
jgi:hypothetical protein